MELEKETLIELMQEYVSDMGLDGKSLEWLTETRETLSKSIADCERAAKEIKAYVITECDGRDRASELVKEKKGELVEAIEMEAELEKVVAKQLDEEIEKRLETSNN